jgi:hypothetical protein
MHAFVVSCVLYKKTCIYVYKKNCVYKKIVYVTTENPKENEKKT